MLNENFIYKLARPVLGARKELSRSDFNTIYSVVQKNEHAAIESILRKYNVHVVESAKAEQSNKANFSSRAKAGQNYDYRKISRLGNEMLCVMAQEGNELALKAIVNKNKGFVYKVAKKMSKQFKNTSLTMDDLFQEGMHGLIEAVHRFDQSLDNKLLTYAWHWIRQSIVRAVVNTGYLVRLPVHAFENLFKICRLRQQHPLAETTELLKTFNRGVGESKQISLTQLKTLILYAKIFLNTLSLNHVQIDESGLELQDMIPDNRNSPVEDIILHNSLKRDLMKALKTLTPREAKVLILRYGLQDNQSRSLELVGKAIGVTRERIRQIEKQAIKSLRCPERSKLIACYQEE